MKPLLALLFLASLVGCASGSPPSGFERALYNVTTNYVTNIVGVAQVDTNRVVTNVAYVTNIVAAYQLEPRESVITGIQTGGQIATTFGFGLGGVIASLLLGAYGAWASWRSKKRADLNTVFAQGIETAREVIKAQPRGSALDAGLKEQLKAQQVDAGVKVMAADVVDSKVNTVDAKESAAKIVA